MSDLAASSLTSAERCMNRLGQERSSLPCERQSKPADGSAEISKSHWTENSAQPLVAHMGRVDENKKYLAQHSPIGGIPISELARFLVSMEMIERRDVSGPVDILIADRNGAPH